MSLPLKGRNQGEALPQQPQSNSFFPGGHRGQRPPRAGGVGKEGGGLKAGAVEATLGGKSVGSFVAFMAGVGLYPSQGYLQVFAGGDVASDKVQRVGDRPGMAARTSEFQIFYFVKRRSFDEADCWS